MKKKWVTIFPRCENVHITKEVGVIPGIISEQFAETYDCFLVSWRNGEYPNKDLFFPKLQHTFIKKILFTKGNKYLEAISELFSVFYYLMREGKSIDVIHFFHLRWYTSLLILYFKKINPNGKVYVKLDAAHSILAIDLHTRIVPILPLKYEKVLNVIDVISIETKMLAEKLSSLWQREVQYIPNGYYPYDFKKVTTDKKRNQLIHVSRMGVPVKNSEFLLAGLVKNQEYLSEEKWKVLLVGEMTDGFKKKLEMTCNENPRLNEIIEVCGKVSDKEKLLELYQESRIFVLTSRNESFGIALVEALATGNQVLTSNIISAPDIVATQKNGLIYENENMADFSEKLIQLIQNNNWENDCEYVQEFAKKNFYYPTIIERLMGKINE